MGCGSAGAWKSIKALICCELQQTQSGSSSNEEDCNFPLARLKSEFASVPEAQTWDFDIFEYASTHPEDFMTRITGFALDHLGSVKSLRLDHKLLSTFIADIQRSYLDHVPYHNAVHATDIVQAVFYTLTCGQDGFRLRDLLTADEASALIFAALGHDINHQGLTNFFLRESKHELAQIDEENPNESMHWRVFSDKLAQWKVLDDLEENRRERLREMIRELILATNMDHHAKILSDWKRLEPQFTLDNPEHRMALMQYVLKFADISNPARPKILYDKWTRRLREELHQEGDKMKEIGLEPDHTRDRSHKSAVSKVQCWFIQHRVVLYLKNINKFGPQLPEPEAQLEKNLKDWKKRQAC
ncbi:Oidioi.mRNA.OKI2018_I69.chr2.g8136.t1.cds [Oikopleura dioica]|uniref:Oidioi.mRNA.OKI2018_I69.chr2.g8136.t1.cds n=1 Tax=Oikopleura dioica TaxID=34765 RepID=A0ABN7TGH3_OIKDI|nr:Oidioi.mRNA.OKI2018_I69.chr2.g8136.t1.cds [Oikopleura dioica]